MKIAGSVALVTGANRGLGRAYTRELVSRGAAKVYGAARQPGQVTEPGQIEVLVGDRTRTIKASLSRDHELIYPPVQEFWDAAIQGSH